MIPDRNYRSPLILAIVLHAILFVALFIHFTSKSSQATLTQSSTQIINATVVNQNSSPSKPTPIKNIEPPKPVPTQQPQQKQEQREEVKQELIKQQEIKQQQKEQLAQELVAHQAELKKQEQQKIADQLQQELAAEQKKAKAKKQLAAKKAAEQAAKQLLQQELAASASNAESDTKAVDTNATAQSAQSQGEVDKYKTLIIQAISQQWIVPDNLQKGVEAKLLVTLAPGGMVLSVKITQSSGDAVLDRSAETAVYKASPLPVPADSALFNKFRTINLIVRPEGILTSG